MSERYTWDDLRGAGLGCVAEAPHDSLAWAWGYQMNLLALSVQNAVRLNDESWDDTAYIHAKAVGSVGRLMLEATA